MERFSREPANDREAIRRDLEDAGINHPGDWRKAIEIDDESSERGLGLEEQVEQTEMKAGRIENEDWQNQLDSAFRRGDYSLIQTLQRVRPESAPSVDLARSRLSKLLTSRPRGWAEDLKKVRTTTRIKFEPAVLADEFGKLFDELGLNEREHNRLRYDQLVEFKKATGYSPESELVQQKYRTTLARGSITFDFSRIEDFFRTITSLTGVRPDKLILEEFIDNGKILEAKAAAPLFGIEITNEMIQRAYEVQFEKYGKIDMSEISKIGKQLNRGFVEKMYLSIVEKHSNRWLDEIKYLVEKTEIQPVFTPEQLYPIFDEYLNNGWFGREDSDLERVIQFTGMKPPLELIEKAAIKIIDRQIDQGREVKKSVDRLRVSTGVDFIIPESAIQVRYQQAIINKKIRIISNLYDAFGIRPSIDQERARQLMVEIMDTAYPEAIQDFEKSFDVRFYATAEEIETKYNKRLGEFNFYAVDTIKKLTGTDCEKGKIEAAILKLLEKEALIPPHRREGYTSWGKNIQKEVERYGITFLPEQITQIYESVIQTKTIYAENLTHIHDITGIPLSAALAQSAYEKILSLDYVSTETVGSTTYPYGQASAVEEIYKISGALVDVQVEQLQQFYRSKLEGDTSEIRRISQISGIQPAFVPTDISQLYKQWILGGKEQYINQAVEVTGVQLLLDDETLAYVSGQIKSGIEKAQSGDYMQEEYGEKKFNEWQLDRDLRRVSSLIAATGVRPDNSTVQSAYVEILVHDPYWVVRIKEISKATGLVPVFSSERLQIKGEELLEKDDLRGFQCLQQYGHVTVSPELAERVYSTFLASNTENYNRDWIDRMERLQALCGVALTETQLVEIFSQISQDEKLIRNRYDRVNDAIRIFAGHFQATITAEMAKDIALIYLSLGDLEGMQKFKEKVDSVPEFSDEDLLPIVNRLLKEKKLDIVAKLKHREKLLTVLVDDTILQSLYSDFASQTDFGNSNSRSWQSFMEIFRLTGRSAALLPEQIEQIYKSIRLSNWQRIQEVTGLPPSSEAVQYRYFQYLKNINFNTSTESIIGELQALTSQSPSVETIDKVFEYFASEGAIQEIVTVGKLTGVQPKISFDFGQKVYRKIIEQFGLNNSISSSKKLITAIDFLNDICGIRPDNEAMYQVYLKTFGETDYENHYEGLDGKRIYPKFWEYLIKKFGKPDSEVVQRIYLVQLVADKSL